MRDQSGSARVLYTLSLSLCICMLGMGVVNPLLPYYGRTLGASDTFLGLIAGAFSVSRFGATMVSGYLSDVAGRRRLILTGLGIYALSSLCYLYASAAWHLLCVRLLNGVGSAFVIPIAMAIGSEVAPVGRQGRYFGVMQMASFLGIGCGPLLSGLLVNRFGVKSPFMVMTVMTVAAFIGVFAFVPGGVGDNSSGTRGMMGSLKGIVKDRVLSRVLTYQSITAFGRGMMLLLFPLLAGDLNLSVAYVGYLLAAVSISSAAFQRLSGALADFFPRRYLAQMSLTLSALALVLLPLQRSFGGMMAVALLYGAAGALGTPATMAMVTDRSVLFGSGASMGAYNMAFSLGYSTGSLVGGMLHHAGLVTGGLRLVAAAMILACLLFRLASLGETIPAPEEKP